MRNHPATRRDWLIQSAVLLAILAACAAFLWPESLLYPVLELVRAKPGG